MNILSYLWCKSLFFINTVALILFDVFSVHNIDIDTTLSTALLAVLSCRATVKAIGIGKRLF